MPLLHGVPHPPAGWPEHVLTALAEEAEIRKRNQALVLCLPTSHWPEQVTQPSPKSRAGEIHPTHDRATEMVWILEKAKIWDKYFHLSLRYLSPRRLVKASEGV